MRAMEFLSLRGRDKRLAFGSVSLPLMFLSLSDLPVWDGIKSKVQVMAVTSQSSELMTWMYWAGFSMPASVSALMAVDLSE